MCDGWSPSVRCLVCTAACLRCAAAQAGQRSCWPAPTSSEQLSHTWHPALALAQPSLQAASAPGPFIRELSTQGCKQRLKAANSGTHSRYIHRWRGSRVHASTRHRAACFLKHGLDWCQVARHDMDGPPASMQLLLTWFC